MAFGFLKSISSSLVPKTYDYCVDFLERSRCKSLPFHSVEHTKDVYNYSKTIAQYEEVFGAELEPVLIAALFHDTGMAETYADHEELSAVFAEEYLKKNDYPEDKITIVKNCILATKMPQKPKTKAEKIICDADLYHLGIEEYIFRNERLRAEWEDFFGKKYTDDVWYEMNMEFLKNQKYHTWFGKTVLTNRKELNYKMMRERREKYLE